MPAFGGVPATFYYSDAATNTVANLVVTDHRSSGTAAANYGSGILFSGQDASGNPEEIASVGGIWTVATSGSEASAIAFFTRRAGAARAEYLRYDTNRLSMKFGTAAYPASYDGVAAGSSSAVAFHGITSSTTLFAGVVLESDSGAQLVNLMWGSSAAGTFLGQNLANAAQLRGNCVVLAGTSTASNMYLGTHDIAQLTFITDAGMTANKVLCTGMATSLAAANNLAPDIVGNTVIVTGNTQINLIANTSRPAGTNLTLIFTGTPTVKHATATSGANQTILLSGSVDFVAAANSVLSLVNDGTSWQERSRKVA